MNVLVLGARHALAWKLAQSAAADTVVAPGNAGTAREPGICNVALDPMDFDALTEFARANQVGLGCRPGGTAAVVDRFEAEGLRCFGPRAGAAHPARTFLPGTTYALLSASSSQALAYLREQGAPIVVKADGLAAGKGVIVAETLAQAEAAV
jgi:phosphoribosylamine--glycine ligase